MNNSLLKEKKKKAVSEIFETERETLERKKCRNCLTRVKIEYLKCPHCGSTYFVED